MARLCGVTGRWFAVLATVLILVSVVGCSQESPLDEPTATPPAPAMPSPTTSGPAVLPATTMPPAPTATQAPPPTAVAPTNTSTATVPAPTEAPLATAHVPTATPLPEELRVASERVFALVKELMGELGHREAATPEELRAALLIKERLDAMGYQAEMESFTFEHFDVARYQQTRGQNAQVIVESPIQAQSPGLLLSTTPRGGSQTGSLVVVGPGGPQDLDEEDLTGKVVLIQPGDIAVNESQALLTLLDMVDGANAQGAVAAVISGRITGIEQYSPLFGAASSMPALILPQAEIGEQLRAMSQSGEVTVSVNIETNELESQSVVAELRGDGDGLVIVGGHYDVVAQTEEGANDNTSGIAVVLALAEALSGESLPFTVRFIAFGAEEVGLYGSIHHVDSMSHDELGRIRAMLNFDVVASGPLLSVTGHEELEGLALRVASGLGIESASQPLPSWATSDHQPFESAGVPVLSLYGPDVSRIHTPQDLLEFVQPELLGGAFLVAEALLKSPEFGVARASTKHAAVAE